MDKSIKEHINQVLKGIWSPFLRSRIKREILDHLSDISHERSITIIESLSYLGSAVEANQLYKNLMYKKLKQDALICSGTFSCLFLVAILLIHQKVEQYQAEGLQKYSQIENKYNKEVLSLNHFSRTSEKKNAAKFLASVIDDKGVITNENFLSEIHQYDYWEPAELLHGPKKKLSSFSTLTPGTLLKLAKFSLKQLEATGNKEASIKDHKKLAQLMYSTETMIGYRIANNMMEGNLVNKDGKGQLYTGTKANRVSGVTWGLLSMRPSIIGLEKTFRDKNYYKTGICHHALDFWGTETYFQNITKSTLPGEKGWAKELNAIAQIKTKMKKECRLSFLDYTTPEKAMTWESTYVTPELVSFEVIKSRIYFTVSNLPYLRNILGRQLVDRISIGLQGEGQAY